MRAFWNRRSVNCMGAFLCMLAFVSGRADARPVYLTGHSDVGVEYEDGELILHYHLHDGVKDEFGNPLVGEFQPNELYTRVPDITAHERPIGAEWDFLGVSGGSPVWILPATELSGAPFLGFGTEHLDVDEWTGAIDFMLVDLEGPGEVSLWNTDSFGLPNPEWQSSNGIDGTDVYSLGLLGHSHMNWGFTAEGIYNLTITASGMHNTQGLVSDTETFTFLVGNNTMAPEPGTMIMMILGIAGMFCWIRRRLK